MPPARHGGIDHHVHDNDRARIPQRPLRSLRPRSPPVHHMVATYFERDSRDVRRAGRVLSSRAGGPQRTLETVGPVTPSLTSFSVSIDCHGSLSTIMLLPLLTQGSRKRARAALNRKRFAISLLSLGASLARGRELAQGTLRNRVFLRIWAARRAWLRAVLAVIFRRFPRGRI